MPADALPAKEAAIPLLARGLSTDAAGAEVGVNGRTVRRWLDDPAYERQIQEVRQAVLGETIAALTAAVREAVDVLRAALADHSPVIRVRAASELLKALPGLADYVDHEARITAIEARAAKEDKA